VTHGFIRFAICVFGSAPVWKIVDRMVRRGLMTADVAIDQIYAIYGQQADYGSVTNAIRDDVQRGRLNPNLR
jgi:hypothetical protein